MKIKFCGLIAVIVGIWSFFSPLTPLAAQSIKPEQIPSDLKPWVDWVVTKRPDAFCPVVGDEARCVWPGLLKLDLGPAGGHFEQRIFTDREIEVELAGSIEYWPQNVRVDAQTAVVLEREERPAIRMPPGEHRIDGNFYWNHLPEVLAIPGAIAAVSLTLDGKAVDFPRRDEGSKLWLKQSATEQTQSDQLELKVHRRIDDGVPLRIISRVILRAGGVTREINLGNVLLDGTVAMALNADLPVRLDPNGDLLVQVQAGTYQIEVIARTQTNPERLSSVARPVPWPAQEIWVWSADEELRQVNVSGVPGIDPARTDLAAEWRNLPAYLVEPGATMNLTAVRRGEPEPPPNQLELRRELWLDLDGKGYTVRDRFSGKLEQRWRVDLLDGDLGRVTEAGVDQLVTRSPGSGRPGVELRRRELDLVAEWRAEDKLSQLPAVGWSEDIQNLNATLNLPPGWQLAAVSGVDQVQTWLNQWDLLGFFFVLIVSLAFAKIAGISWGVVALIALVLCQHETDNPNLLWLPLLAATALLSVLKPGNVALVVRASWWASLLALLVVALPFAVSQIRTAIYPQIDQREDILSSEYSLPTAPATAPEPDYELKREEARGAAKGEGAGLKEAEPSEVLDKPAQRAAPSVAPAKTPLGTLRQDVAQNVGLNQLATTEQQQIARPELGAVVQTGPGVPAWRWRQWRLSWSGPVTRDHQIRLWLISPGLNRLLALLRVILLALIALRLVRATPPRPSSGLFGEKSARPEVGPAAAILLGLLSISSTARADFPSQELLDQLEQRLAQPPDCRPHCVSVAALTVTVEGGSMRMLAEVHAGEATSFQIPGPASNWVPASARLDGVPTASLALLEDGFIHIRLPMGPHRVEMTGPLPTNDAITLTLGLPPHRVAISAPGWTVEGLREDGRATGSIQLVRKLEKDSPRNLHLQNLPPWLEITRTFQLGTSWTVMTEVRRVSPTGSPVVARYPLLPGESVTESSALVEKDEVIVTLSRDQGEMSWTSSLKEQPKLIFKASANKPWSEIWLLQVGPVWHCRAEGLAPFRHQNQNHWEPGFRPWPGEALQVVCTKPVAAPGQSFTIDSANLEIAPGARMLHGSLHLGMRSSAGFSHTTTVPASAQIQSLTIDGHVAQFRQKQGSITYTIYPGTHQLALSWQQPQGIAIWQKFPAVSLNAPAANVRLSLRLPTDRWLLWAGGPSWGPAILFWGYLVLILFVALALPKAPRNPLRSWQWVLLMLGLTQLPAPVLLVIVGWFFALAFREKYPPPERPILYDLTQLVLLGWTLATMGCLYAAVHEGLLVQPDMQVTGAGSSDTELIWYIDRIAGPLPAAYAVAVSIWVWKVLTLFWSLWLASSLLKWLPWAWRCYNAHGAWKPLRRPRKPAATPPQNAPAP